MPFEVYAVEGVVQNMNRENRQPDIVAREIRDHYNAVARRGGEIIAGHTLDCKSPSHDAPAGIFAKKEGLNLGYTGKSYLFLVAEFPEKSPLE